MIKINIEVEGKKYEIIAEDVLISFSNSKGDKIAGMNKFISDSGNLATAMRMYCGLGKYINEEITNALYDETVPLDYQVASFAPKVKMLKDSSSNETT